MTFCRFFVFVCLLFLTACGESRTPAPVMHYGATGGADSAGVHTVGAGDTLWNIAQRYRLSMRDVIYKNELQPPYVLAVGQRLTLPPPATYRVRAGDTLYGVSRTFNVSMTEIARQNRLSDPYTIHEGDTLRLPFLMAAAERAAAPPRPVQKSSDVGSQAPAPAKTANAAVRDAPPPRAAGKFAWPVTGKVISSYGPKQGGLHNDGINIKAPQGTPVRAAENGVVVYAGNELKGYGNLILVRHADRWMTAYAHMDSFLAKRGETVRRGQSLGTVGATGHVDTPQLHFEIRRGTAALNPKQYLGG